MRIAQKRWFFLNEVRKNSRLYEDNRYLYPAYLFDSGLFRIFDPADPDIKTVMFLDTMAAQLPTSFASALAGKTGQTVEQKILDYATQTYLQSGEM